MSEKKIELFGFNTLLYFLIRGCFLGICINNLFYTSKSNSCISIIIAVLLGFIPLYILLKLMDKHPDKNIFGMLECEFGIFGKILSYILAMFVFLFACVILWNLLNFISSQLLHKTPNIAIGFLLLLAINHALQKGINVISRVSVILFFSSLVLYLMCFLGLTMQIKPIMYFPLLNEGFKSISLGSINFIAFNILPIFILSVIPKNLINRNKELIKNSIRIYLLSSFTLFFVIFLILGIYGIEFCQLLQYPEYHLLKRFSILGFIDRTENIFSIQWLFDTYIFLILSLYFVGERLNFKSKFKYPIMCISLLILSNFIFTNSTIAHSFILRVFPFFLFFFLMLVPLSILLKKKTTL